MTSDSEAAGPALRIVNPDATPEEIAALVAVFSALGDGGDTPRPKPRVWNHPDRLVRATYHSGPGAWRASGLPR